MIPCGRSTQPFTFFSDFLYGNALYYHLIRHRDAFKKLSPSLVSYTKFTLSSVIQAKEDGWKMWRMSAGRSETERKGRQWSGEGRGTLPSHRPSSLNLASTLFYLWWGWDRTSWQQHAKRCVKLQNQTIKLRHALSLNTITWRLQMDNPLKPDQRKVWILKWAAVCVYMQKELIWVAVYMTAACNPVREYSASCHKELMCVSVIMKNSRDEYEEVLLLYLCSNINLR